MAERTKPGIMRSWADIEISEHFSYILNPATFCTGSYRFLRETLRSRNRRRLAQQSGISDDPNRDRILLTGQDENWTSSWFRHRRKWQGFKFVSVGSQSREEPVSPTSLMSDVGFGEERRMTREELFNRSTGEIHEGQTDDFDLIGDVILPPIGSSDVITGPDDVIIDPHWFAANVFWRPKLSFCRFTVGGATVSFDSLWPGQEQLKLLLMESLTPTSLRTVVGQLTLLALRCGPLRLLRTILELGLIDLQHGFTEGLTMLHVGCISQNFDACLFLCTLGANRTARDKKGRKPYDVCRCQKIRKLLPSPHQKGKLPSADWLSIERNSFDRKTLEIKDHYKKEDIFVLAEDDTKQDELQILLQSEEFSREELINNDGDHLVHIVTRKGLPYLTSLMNLSRLQDHDVDVTNADGMTSLMIAASDGSDVMCDVLICILGADPNAQNTNNGYTALHYAASKGHLEVVCTLLHRGVNPNTETTENQLPDDLARVNSEADCVRAIIAARDRRRKELAMTARQGDLAGRLLYDSDLTIVDQLGDTLLMTATRLNRVDNVKILLSRKSSIIDAQNAQSGKTSLTLAASMGHVDLMEALLVAGANPRLPDTADFLPLHHAVMGGHLPAVEGLLERESCWHGFQKALRLSPSRAITHMLEETKIKRQEVIVCPALLEGALTGNVDLLYDTLEEGDDVNPISGEGNWPALLAASGGHLEVLKYLSQNGGNIWGRHENTHDSLLHVACTNGHEAVAAFLLKQYTYAGAEEAKRMINYENIYHQAALHLAAENGFARTVKLLLQHGASTCILDDQGQLYNCRHFQGIQHILQAERTRHLDDIISAIKHPTNPVQRLKQVYEPSKDFRLKTTSGDSPLLVACHHGNLDVIKFLLDSFPDSATQRREVLRRNSRDGGTVMHRAVQGGDHVTLVQLLAAIDETLVNAGDAGGRTPLHHACALGRRNAVAKLTAMPGIDVNATDVNKHKPDDVTKNQNLRHMISSARLRQGVSNYDVPESSPGAGNIDFDDLNQRFLTLKSQHSQKLSRPK